MCKNKKSEKLENVFVVLIRMSNYIAQKIWQDILVSNNKKLRNVLKNINLILEIIRNIKM